MSLRSLIKLRWRRWRKIRELKSLECYLFNCAPGPKWAAVRDENTRLGVWNGTYRLPEEKK